MVPTDAPQQGLVVLGHLIGRSFDTEDSYPGNGVAAAAPANCESASNDISNAVVVNALIGAVLLLTVIIACLAYRVHDLSSVKGDSVVSGIEFSTRKRNDAGKYATVKGEEDDEAGNL